MWGRTRHILIGKLANAVLQQLCLGLVGVDGIELLRRICAGHDQDAVAATRVVAQEWRSVIDLRDRRALDASLIVFVTWDSRACNVRVKRPLKALFGCDQ